MVKFSDFGSPTKCLVISQISIFKAHFNRLQVDEQIIQDAASFKMDLSAGLERTLQGKVKISVIYIALALRNLITDDFLVITQCSMRHLYVACASNQPLILEAKAFERRRCNHHTLEQPLSSLECLLSVVDPKQSQNNKHRYAVASQDAQIRARMRHIPGVPLIYISRSVMVLEPMTTITSDVRERHEKGKLRNGLKDMKRPKGRRSDDENTRSSMAAGPKALPDSHDTDGNSQHGLVDQNRKRKRGPKGPNPLSVRKPKERYYGSGGKTKPLSEDTVNGVNATREVFNSEDAVRQEKKRRRKHKISSDDT